VLRSWLEPTVLDEETGEYNLPILRRLWAGQPLCIVILAERQQGFLLPRATRAGWRRGADLAQPGLRFANRQPGSGTRTLLDYHLRREGISSSTIAGYQSVLPTHLAVAAAVAEGRADVGLGIPRRSSDLSPRLRAPGARALRSDPATPKDRDRAPLCHLLDMVRSAEFLAVVAELGGYDTHQSGREIQLS